MLISLSTIFHFESFSTIGFAWIPRWVMFGFNMCLHVWFVFFMQSTSLTKPKTCWSLYFVTSFGQAWKFESIWISYKSMSSFETWKWIIVDYREHFWIQCHTALWTLIFLTNYSFGQTALWLDLYRITKSDKLNVLY